MPWSHAAADSSLVRKCPERGLGFRVNLREGLTGFITRTCGLLSGKVGQNSRVRNDHNKPRDRNSPMMSHPILNLLAILLSWGNFSTIRICHWLLNIFRLFL